MHALTLVSEDVLTAFDHPEDGDDLDAAIMEVLIQRLANKSLAHRNALLGQLVWNGDFGVDSGGTLTSFTVRVGDIGKLFVADSSGVCRVGLASATSFGVAKVEGTPGTLGAVARWWYVYAFLTTGGSVDYAISTTAPSTDRRFKSGDATRVYLGCFRTLATGAPLPLRKAAGRVLYQSSALGSNELRAINVTTATAVTTVSLSTLIPPHARLVTLRLALTADVNAAVFSIFYPADTAAPTGRVDAPTGLSIGGQVDVPTESNQSIDYAVTGTGTIAASAFVHGFYE